MYHERHFLLPSSLLVSSSLQEINLFLGLWIRVINFCLPHPTLLYGCMLRAAYYVILLNTSVPAVNGVYFKSLNTGFSPEDPRMQQGSQTWLHQLLWPDSRFLLPPATQDVFSLSLLAVSENDCRTLHSCFAMCSIPIFFSQIPVPPFF